MSTYLELEEEIIPNEIEENKEESEEVQDEEIGN